MSARWRAAFRAKFGAEWRLEADVFVESRKKRTHPLRPSQLETGSNA